MINKCVTRIQIFYHSIKRSCTSVASVKCLLCSRPKQKGLICLCIKFPGLITCLYCFVNLETAPSKHIGSHSKDKKFKWRIWIKLCVIKTNLVPRDITHQNKPLTSSMILQLLHGPICPKSVIIRPSVTDGSKFPT